MLINAIINNFQLCKIEFKIRQIFVERKMNPLTIAIACGISLVKSIVTFTIPLFSLNLEHEHSYFSSRSNNHRCR